MVSLLGQLNHILSLSYEPRERLVARLPKTVGISLTTSGCSPLSPGLPSSWCVPATGHKSRSEKTLCILVHFTSREILSSLDCEEKRGHIQIVSLDSTGM